MMPKSVLIDTDVGTDVDDALALALAVKSPELDLCAITTACADSLLRARIARKIMDLSGHPEIPVAAGLGSPLLRQRVSRRLGHEGKGILESDEDGLPIDSRHAGDLIVDTIMQAEKPPTLITIGPVSNVALAIIKQPSIIQQIEQLVIMGGCIYPERVGNGQFPEHVAARMEHNLGADPEASEVVFTSGIPILLVPAEVTYSVWLTEEDRSRLKESNTVLAKRLSTLVDIWIDVCREMWIALDQPESWARAYLHDPLTVTTAFDQSFVGIRPMHVRIERKEGLLRTLVEPDMEPNMEVVVAINTTAFRESFLDRVTVE